VRRACSEPLKRALRATRESALILGVRPNDISVVMPAAERLNGEVTLVQPQGNRAILTVSTLAGPATAIVPADRRPAAGSAVGLVCGSEGLHLFDSTARSLNREEGGG
jgi:ABC-type sugar transport system ATPase subunit